MQKPLTTNEVRRVLEYFGAVKPGRAAVAMIAREIPGANGESFWEIILPRDLIGRAVQACYGLKGQESYNTFRKHLCQRR